MLVDTHAHLNFKAFKKDYREAIERAFDAGVFGIINVGSSLKNSKKAIDIAEEYEKGIHAAVGIHPVNIDSIGELPLQVEEVRKLAQCSEKVVALGETGLDLFHNKETKEYQRKLFEAMLNLTWELDLPLIIHCREAFRDLIRILKSTIGNQQKPLQGVVHCFSGNLKQARQIADLGLYISFTGNITYANDDESRQVIEEIPLEKMMVETDAPFLAPVPYRRTRNEPSYVVEIAKKIAQIKGVLWEKVASITTENAQSLFGI